MLTGTAAVLWAGSPNSVWACAVCMDDEAANRVAYIAMTFLLTVLPFVLVGSLGFYIWRKQRQAEAEENRVKLG